MKHYVYKLTDKKTGEYYFGSRSHTDPTADTYMGSFKVLETKNELVKEILRDDFKTREEAIKYEGKVIEKNIDDKLNRNYYIPNKGFHTLNLDVCSKDAFIRRYGEEEGNKRHKKWLCGITNTMKQKMKMMNDEERKEKFGSPGEKNPRYGKTWSEEWKKEQSKRMREYYKTHTPPRRGSTHTNEAKKKMSEVRKEYYKNNTHPKTGIKYTEEQKNKIKEGLKTQPRVTCPYCGITTNKGNAKRWHFDSCKQKVI